MKLSSKPSKIWIYLPLYLLLVFLIVHFSWKLLNPKVEPVIISNEVVESRREICFSENCQDLSGLFKLWPSEKIAESFHDLDIECSQEICTYCKENNELLPTIEVLDSDCFQKIYNDAYSYHFEHLSKLPLARFFYNSGEKKINKSQVKDLSAICSIYNKNSHGAVIIGRASKNGSDASNEYLSEKRAINLQNLIHQFNGQDFKVDYIYFGSKPPQLNKNTADLLNISQSEYANKKVSGARQSDFSFRLNQSAIVVFYPLVDDPFGRNESKD